MNQGPASDARSGGEADLEAVLFACLETDEAKRDSAFADACHRHPALADALQRCWQRIRGLKHAQGVPEQVAGYRILSRLGGGGMGVVYLAEQDKLGRKVALKLIRSDLLESDQARERFQREALAASRLEHPGLCPVFDIGEAGGVPFMVMPYLEGITLTARLAELAQSESTVAFSASSARRELVRVVATMARAVHHAHEHGLVHRDIKPGNIMLLPDGRAMLLDFGLARDERLDAPTLTRTGERVGTPAYMAPEQIKAEGDAIDRRTDVYALGVVLCEVVILSMPFGGSDLLGLREQILSGIRQARLRRGVPHDLASIILKAADPEPARRYASAAELADDLDRFLRLEPVHARRLGVVKHTARWIRRHPVVSGLLFALAVALGIAGLALEASLRKERQFRSLAWQGESRAAERTDSQLALERALAADELDPTPRSLVQLNRALQCDRELHRWRLDGWVNWLGFSPDKKSLYVVTRNGSFHAFEVATHRQLAHARGPKDIRVDRATLAPDGSFLVVGARGRQALLWRLRSDEVESLGNAHEGNVWDVAVSSDSKTIYTAGYDGAVGRWNAVGGQLDAPFPWQSMTSGEARTVRCVGDRVVFGGTDEFAVVRADGSGLMRTRLPRLINDIAFAPDVDRFFLWELGQDGLFDSEGHTQRLPGVDAIAPQGGNMSPRGDRVAIGQSNGTLRIYDLRRAGRGVSGVADASYRDCVAGDGPVGPVQFTADGQRLLACGGDFSVHVLAANGDPLLRLYGFTKPVELLDYDPDGELLATGDGAGVVRLWDVRVRRTKPPEFQAPGANFSGFAAGGTDPVIACCGDGRLFVFPVGGDEPVVLEGHRGVIDDARVERGGRRLASGCVDHTARVWDLASRQPLWTTPVFGYGRPVGVDFLPAGRLLVVLGGNSNRPSEFQVWHIGQSGEQPEAKWTGPKGSGRLNHGAAAPDGRHIVVASYPGLISIVPVDLACDPVRFGEAISIPHDQPVLHIDFAPAGDRFVAACADNSARIYDLQGRPIARCVNHEKRVEVARFSPSGKRVVTASADGTARIWNAATGAEEMVLVVGAPSPVWDAQFSADEKVLYTVSIDGVVRGWLLDRVELRELSTASAGR